MISVPHECARLRTDTVLLEDQYVIFVSGELDLATVGTFHAAVHACLDTRPTRVLIDLRETSFCDCTGLRALLRSREEIVRAGADCRIRGPLHPLVARLVDRTRTGDRLGLSAASPEGSM
ncbi:STAS domain-containing protein [Streptomyces sp. NPDC093510]|uniref:STAS domain-containing protein n=1 Tax=Streptomyces sp. NPDC093510 TaxID=3155199 RepID=UPI00341EE983